MDLRKEMYFRENSTTSLGEINDLAEILLRTEWVISYRKNGSLEFSTINLSKRGWVFEFNNRKRAAGLCSKRNKSIYISKYLLEQNLDKSLEFENVLRHEIAHAIDFEIRKKSNHDNIWKSFAKQVLCTAERCYDGDVIKTVEKTKYTLVCDNCGKESKRHKKTRRVLACGACCKTYNGGRFTDKFLLKEIQNY